MESAEVTGRHKGATFVVLGNGPSINKLDLVGLDVHITIGVNRIGLIFYPDYLLWLDAVTTTMSEVRNAALRADQSFCPAPEGEDPIPKFPVTYFNRYRPAEGDPILSDNWEKGLFWSVTSTFAAINLAFLMGARKIAIAGVDMHDYKHFYTGKRERDTRTGKRMPYEDVAFLDFARLAVFAHKHNFEVVNLNPDSAVRCFPFETIEEV